MASASIVIPLHKRGGKLKDDSELRFALRALEKHFKDDFTITIVGERIPKWLTGVRHLKKKGGLKRALKSAAAEYPDGFFWWYDDVILLKDATIEDLKISFAKKGLNGSTGWSAGLTTIRKKLDEQGIEPWDYSHPHGPYWFDKSMVDEGFEDWPGMKGKFPWESWILSKRKWPSRTGPYKQYYGEFKAPPGESAWYLNFNERGFTTELRKYLYGRFSLKSKFEKGHGLWTVGAKAGNDKYSIQILPDRVIKTELKIDDKRLNRLSREAEILHDLNLKGCPCVPRLLDFGLNDLGQYYLVTERIMQSDDPPAIEDIFLSYLAVRACGYEHGDLMESNVIFDGKVAWLIDFDRSYPATSEFNWGGAGDGTIDPGLIEHFDRLSKGSLDLSKTAIAKGRNIYHSIRLKEEGIYPLQIKGERDVSGRKPILEKIKFLGESVLDIGCNTGDVTRYLLLERGASRADGIEYNPLDAKLGQFTNCIAGLNKARIRHGKIGEGDLIGGYYDTILLFSVLHHFLHPFAAATEIAGRCDRLLIEAKLNESGHWYGGKGNTFRLPKWNFTRWTDLAHHIEGLFPGFRFVQDYGEGDRDRHILEFKKSINDPS